MNERLKTLCQNAFQEVHESRVGTDGLIRTDGNPYIFYEKFAELIVQEVCGMMEQAEDDAYHCFEPSERPTEYIEWLRDWQERFTKHFGVEE
jgi:hypothetical protein